MNRIILIIIVLLFTNIFRISAQTSGFNTPTNSYRADSIIYYNADSSVRFGATLTLPVMKKTCPAVIIVSGTGKQDRDGTMAGHKMFAAIADYLTKQGIAVLRVDDRGKGLTTGVYETATTGDFANDVLAGINYLKKRKEINPKKIGLIGHSEGGAVISIAAAKSKDVAFLVSIAGLAMPGLEALIKQNKDIVENSGALPYDKVRADQINNLMFNTVYANADSVHLEQILNRVYNNWKKSDDEYFKTLNVKFDHFRFPIYSYAKTASGSWYRFFIKYDPKDYLPKVKVPILALNGDKDLMVSCSENLNNWKKYPAMGGNTHVKTVELTGVNHLFQHCSLCTSQEYAKLDEAFDNEALVMISDWIKKSTM